MGQDGLTGTPMDPAEFRRRGYEVIDSIADYWERLHADAQRSTGEAAKFPVMSAVKPGEILSRLPSSPPQAPGGADEWAAVMRDVESIVMPGLTHWQSPNFFAYFPTNSSTPAILGELLATGLGVNAMQWATSPVATELETRMVDWMGEMIGLPESFRSTSPNAGGVIQGTASEGTLIAMLAARHRACASLTATNRAFSKAESTPPWDKVTVYTSTQAHSSVIKAAMIAGLASSPSDRRRLRLIEADEQFRMRPDALARAMQEDADAGLVPAYACATVGTTSSGSVDPVPAIAEVCRKHGAWLHIDAAWAGAACVCPEYRYLLAGVEHADSLCFNPHKWLLTNFECDLFWTRDRASITSALSITPEYLRNAATDAGSVIDYRDWQIPLGKRFRAMKLWFVIRHFGVRGLQEHIRSDVRLGELFESLVKEDARFEVAAPRSLALVCFRLTPRSGGETAEQTDARNRQLLALLNQSGNLHLIHTTLPIGGRPTVVLRMAIGGTLTRADHIRAAWGHIRAAADRVS